MSKTNRICNALRKSLSASRIIILSIMVASTSLCAMTINAQSAESSTDDNADYYRKNLTIIPLTGVTQHDTVVEKAIKGLNFYKFDMNNINVAPIHVTYDVLSNAIANLPKHPQKTHTALEDRQKYDYLSFKEFIQTQLTEQGIGKKILDYRLQFDGKKFNTKLMETRSRYSATDNQVIEDKARKVSILQNNGRTLMKESYVMVIGPSDVQYYYDQFDGKISKYSVRTQAYVFKVKLTSQQLDNIWANWLDESASADKIFLYNQIKPEIQFVGFANGLNDSNKNLEKAMRQTFESSINKLENNIPA